MELKNCENRTVVVLQVKKNKPTGKITGKKRRQRRCGDRCKLIYGAALFVSDQKDLA